MADSRPGPGEVIIRAVSGIPEIRPGDDLAGMVADALGALGLSDRDVVVVTQKVVSKAEHRLEAVDPDNPLGHRPIVEREARRVLRRRGDLLVTETEHGFVCANAGADLSNVEAGWVALLPRDPDRSARRIRDRIAATLGVEVGVIVTDTFGRPWRLGVVDVAIGCAGIRPIVDLRGTADSLGRPLAVTEVAVVDEIAAAAELVMGKARGVPVAVVQGLDPAWFDLPADTGVVQGLVRDPSEDLFR